MNLSDSEDVNMVWENIQDNIKTSVKESLGLYELKQHKPWFDDSHSILVRWRSHFSQLFNVHGVGNVTQTEIRTAEPRVLVPSAFEF